jgi:hypothetical protein
MKNPPSAPHTAEPFDGHERDMHKCGDCARGSAHRWDHNAREWAGCPQFVPSITQPVRCDWFKPRKK